MINDSKAISLMPVGDDLVQYAKKTPVRAEELEEAYQLLAQNPDKADRPVKLQGFFVVAMICLLVVGGGILLL